MTREQLDQRTRELDADIDAEKAVRWKVVPRENGPGGGPVVGTCDLWRWDQSHRHAEFGYVPASALWGQGQTPRCEWSRPSSWRWRTRRSWCAVLFGALRVKTSVPWTERISRKPEVDRQSVLSTLLGRVGNGQEAAFHPRATYHARGALGDAEQRLHVPAGDGLVRAEQFQRLALAASSWRSRSD